MNAPVTKSPGYVIGEISPEQFIAEHTFMYIIKGIMRCYDGNKTYILKSGNYGPCPEKPFGQIQEGKSGWGTGKGIHLF
jgi:hypothetical protein